VAIVKRGKRYGVVIYERGRRRWIGTYGSRLEAAEAEAQATLERRTPNANLTVEVFAKTWLKRYPRPKRSTEVHYAQQIKGFVRVFGSSRLRDLSRSQMRHWAVNHPAGVSTARAMLGDAFRDGLIPSNPLAEMRLPSSRGRRDLIALTEEEVFRLISVAETTHERYGELVYGPMIQFAAYSGLRPGELHGLRWDDVDLRGEVIRVERQFSPKANAFTAPKNGLTREVYLTPLAAEAVRRVPRTTLAEIFTTKSGKHFSGRVSHYYWDPVRAAFGHPELDFYTLRHYFGSMLARMGVNAPEIARAMGHVDGGKLALQRYIHITERESRERIKQALAGRPKLEVVSKEATA
jgi:integrase